MHGIYLHLYLVVTRGGAAHLPLPRVGLDVHALVAVVELDCQLGRLAQVARDV